MATEGCLAQAQSCLLWLLSDHDSHCSQDRDAGVSASASAGFEQRGPGLRGRAAAWVSEAQGE